MFEPVNNSFDRLPANQPSSDHQAHCSAQRLLECIQQQRVSNSRDESSIQNNYSSTGIEGKSIDVSTATKMVNGRILSALASGEPLSDDLKQQALDLHQRSRSLNNEDASSNYIAQAKLTRDWKSEHDAIHADRSALADGGISPMTQGRLRDDIHSKFQLQRNENELKASTGAYLNVDDRDNKMNKIVIDALTSNSPDLAKILRADNASKDEVIRTREQEMRQSQRFTSDFMHDQVVSKNLIDALSIDPYAAAARRHDAHLPVWTKEENLLKAEFIQHEKRRLHLAPSATPEQLHQAQVVDMNKVLNLPPWATREQRIAARNIHQHHHIVPPTEF